MTSQAADLPGSEWGGAERRRPLASPSHGDVAEVAVGAEIGVREPPIGGGHRVDDGRRVVVPCRRPGPASNPKPR
jgi:hypothetical protein